MTERDFDKCPECGAFPVYGLRCHPKFSLKVGMIVGDYIDMVAFYAHDEEALIHLAETLQITPGYDVLSKERWDGEKWVEL